MFVGSVSDGSGAPAPGLSWPGVVMFQELLAKPSTVNPPKGVRPAGLKTPPVNPPFIAAPLKVAATLLNAGAML